MTDRDDSHARASRPQDGPAQERPDTGAAASRPDDDATPPVHERWWWTGTFRAVLGGVVVAYQWPILTSGEAIVWNWVLAGVGVAVVAWGVWLVLTAYRNRP